MSLGIAEIIVLIVVALLFYGIVGKRPAVSLWAAMLLAGGIFLGATLLYFLRSMPLHVAPQPIVMVHEEFGPSVYSPVASSPPELKARVSFLAVILMAGAALATIFFLRRGSCSAAAARGHLKWWPLSLLLLLLPLVFFVGTVHVKQSHQATIWEPAIEHFQHASEVAAAQREVADQQAEVQRQAIEALGEVQRRIASMNIYELMDKFDAPRIVLAGPPAPPPAELPAKAPNEQHSTASSQITASARVSAQPSGSAVMVAAEAVEPVDEAVAEWDDGSATSDAQEVAEVVVPRAVAEAASDDTRRVVSSAPQGPPPPWVDQPPKRVGHVRREVVATEEYATVEECYLAADILLQINTYEHIRWLTGNREDADKFIRMDQTTLSPSELATHATGLFRQLQNAGITVDYIRREIAKDEYLQTVERSVGPMKKLYTLMEFSPSVDGELRQNWEASQRQARFAFVGFGASSVLGLLGLAWGLLKVDTMTKGYYTKRLFIGVPLGIAGAFGLYALLLDMGFDLPH